MLITPRGEPIAPQEAVRRLREIDERLSVKWVPSAAGAYWGIIEDWKRDDPRWQMVNAGEVDRAMAYDLRAMLPADCSAEEAVGFVERHFRPVQNAAKEAAEKVERVQKHNRATKDKHIENFLVEQDEKHVRQTKHDLELVVGAATAHPISSGFGEGTTPGAQAAAKRRKKA